MTTLAVQTFLNYVWESTIFAAAVGVLLMAWRPRSARVRYTLLTAALLKFVLPSDLLFGIVNPIEWALRDYVAIPTVVRTTGEWAAAVLVPLTPASSVASATWAVAAVVVWIAGAALVLVTQVSPWHGVRGVAVMSAPATGREARALRGAATLAGLPSAPPLWLADGADVCVEGLVRPRIVLSRRLANALDDRELEAVLLHEIVHVRRRDGLWALAGAAAVAICWMHPFVWWLRREVAIAREFACDETVVALQRSGRSFARGLAKAVRLASVQPAGALSIGAGDVAARLARLAAPPPMPGTSGPRWALAAAAVLFAAVTLGANPCLK